jgi:hypothetical protein
VATPRRFPIRVGRRSRPLLRLFGVEAGNAWIDVNDELVASFGRYGLRTPMSNVTGYRIEGPWLWITAIGVRMSLRSRDVTFGGSHHGGVRIAFREPVNWFWRLRAPALYVTADDNDALAAVLRARGIPGKDARKQRAG